MDAQGQSASTGRSLVRVWWADERTATILTRGDRDIEAVTRRWPDKRSAAHGIGVAVEACLND